MLGQNKGGSTQLEVSCVAVCFSPSIDLDIMTQKDDGNFVLRSRSWIMQEQLNGTGEINGSLGV